MLEGKRQALQEAALQALATNTQYLEHTQALAGLGELGAQPQVYYNNESDAFEHRSSMASILTQLTAKQNEHDPYAEQITEPGFVFMDSPGYDPCAVTGQIASGANIICFTTGRGSMFGSKPSPTIKLATNTPMFTRLEEDMDINCGKILDGLVDVQQMGQEIFEHILRTASGEKSKSELLNLGDNEFVPWHLGIVS
jgi:altronate hydrolase